MGSVGCWRAPGQSDLEFFAEELLEGDVGRVIECASMPAGGEWSRVFYAAVRDRSDPSMVWAMVVPYSGIPGRGEFVYKPMDETQGPCEDRCPPKVLDHLTATGFEHANAWRERCRAEAAKFAALAPNVTVEFAADYLTPAGPCRRFTVVDLAKGLFRSVPGSWDGEAPLSAGTYALKGWRSGSFDVITA